MTGFGSGDRNQVALHNPPEHYLRGCLLIFLSQRLQDGMALYGDRKYWVRPEKMFFEQIERDGKRFSRFQEIDWEE